MVPQRLGGHLLRNVARVIRQVSYRGRVILNREFYRLDFIQ